MDMNAWTVWTQDILRGESFIMDSYLLVRKTGAWAGIIRLLTEVTFQIQLIYKIWYPVPVHRHKYIQWIIQLYIRNVSYP